jgi:transcriptional regulator with XRE-family HTH domain
MDSDLTFGSWLQARRKSLDMTRGELAQYVGCSVSALRKIESDERHPSKQLAGLLADHLGISADERQIFIRFARGDLVHEPVPMPALISTFQPDIDHPQQTAFTYLPVPPDPLIGRQNELATLE